MLEQLQFGADFPEANSDGAATSGGRRFNGQMLVLAREAKGYTQKDLAAHLKCTQSRLSKIEGGELIPQEYDMQKFARELAQEPSFFFQHEETVPASASFYRKPLTLPLKMLRQCNAEMNVLRLQIERRVGRRKLGRRELPFLPPESHGGAVAVARLLRREWGLNAGAVPCLTGLVEDAGGIIVDYPFPSPKLDGLSIRSADKLPIIFLNRDLPKSRRRLSLAHELGHLVMHTNPHERIEDEAWDFAAEFLAPAAEISNQLKGLNLDKLGRLKSQWGISMQAILHRAIKLEMVTPSFSRFLWIQIGKCGYRLNEPFEDMVPDERPTELENRLNMST